QAAASSAQRPLIDSAPCAAPMTARTAAAGQSRDLAIAAPLFPQLGPIVQALPDFALEAALGRIVEGLPRQRVGKVILTAEGFFGVVVVGVAAAVAFLLHQLGRRVEDVLG